MKRKATEPCDAPLKVWVPQSLLDKIDRLAFEEGRSLSTMVDRRPHERSGFGLGD